MASTSFSNEEKIQKIKSLFWDVIVTEKMISDILFDNKDCSGTLTKANLYARILDQCRWYQVLNLLTLQQVKEALSEDVIIKLFPKDRQKQYRYARSILQRTSVSVDG